jgi:hypothetical protein
VTTQLPERLRELADDAPPTLHERDLWAEGNRRRRRQTVTSLAVAGCLVLVSAVVGLGDWASRRPDPAAPPATNRGQMAIPDRFFTPSPWLGSTRSPGRLVAVISDVTQQHFPWGSSDWGVVGVAAGSQRYSFLDLPGRASERNVALSPDGLHLAYVIRGDTSEARHEAAGGVAILDLQTGGVQTYGIKSQHGLNMADLTWPDPSTLLIQVTREFDAPPGAHYGSAFRGAAFRAQVGQPRLVRLPVANIGYSSDRVSVRRGAAYLDTGRSVEIVDPDTGRPSQRISLSSGLNDSAALNENHSEIAGLQGRGGSPAPLMVGHVVGGHAELTPLLGEKTDWFSVIGWADARHVVATQVVHVGFGDPLRLMSVDVRSRRARLLSITSSDVQLSRDAVVDPLVVPAIAPPHPWSPRSVALWTLVALGLLGFWGYVGYRDWRQRGRR